VSQIAKEASRVQPDPIMRFGITLSNCGVLLGLATVRQLLALADAVEASPLLDSVWVGDALFVNQRLDAVTLLAAIAGRSERVLLGTACMGSFARRDPRVFAYEWASLDMLSNGRTRLAVCSGGGAGAAWNAETQAMVFLPPRRRRMIENVHAVRHLWTRNDAPFERRFIGFGGIGKSGRCSSLVGCHPAQRNAGRPRHGGLRQHALSPTSTSPRTATPRWPTPGGFSIATMK
jgi:Luciferase-like monooxygenase